MHLNYVLPPIVMGLLGLVMRYRTVRRRHGNIPVRMRRAGKKRWSRGHAVWVHDVLAFRASPAAWYESLLWVTDIYERAPTSEDRRRLRRLGKDMAVGTLRLNDGTLAQVAARRQYAPALFGDVATSQDVIEAA
jgi:hypothetical protein